MIKASGEANDGTPIVVLGMTGENMTRLAADEPIMFNLADLGLPETRVCILYGKTGDEVAKKILALVDR